MIKSLDELTAFLKICRKQGVTDISFEGCSVKFGDHPKKLRAAEDTDDADVPTDEPSMDDLIYLSSGGAP